MYENNISIFVLKRTHLESFYCGISKLRKKVKSKACQLDTMYIWSRSIESKADRLGTMYIWSRSSESKLDRLGTMYFPSRSIKQDFKGATRRTLQIYVFSLDNLDEVVL